MASVIYFVDLLRGSCGNKRCMSRINCEDVTFTYFYFCFLLFIFARV